ncbi:MAG: ketopantoate reductase family protein [Dehalococcoidia bacterium]
MRYIMYGAGAIGGICGGKLHLAGHEVILIARGEHLRVIQQDGLTLKTPDETMTLPIAAVSHPSQIEFRAGDVVVLTMKSQDTAAALDDLRAAAGDQVTVACAQNGIENERMALRRFANVYGMVLLMPATYLEPGVVEASAWPVVGVADLGRYPAGVDATAETIAAEWDAAGMASIARDDIMRWKYTKLLQNVSNAVGAVCGDDADSSALQDMVRDETRQCFRAAGYEWIPGPQLTARRAEVLPSPTGPSNISSVVRTRGGSSTWQSLVRGAGSSEGDYLNGEIALLGRLHGIPTPANEVFQALSDQLARERKQPGSVTLEEVTKLIDERRTAYATA